MLLRPQSPIRNHAFSLLPPKPQGKGILSSHSRPVPWNGRTRQRLPISIADDEALLLQLGVGFVEGPRRREAALRQTQRSRRSMMLSTSVKCSAIRVPLRRSQSHIARLLTSPTSPVRSRMPRARPEKAAGSFWVYG